MQSPSEYSGEPRMLRNEDKTWGMACHLAALAGFIFPFGNVIGPLVVWLMKKNESAFIDDQGKESLNFQISASIYMLVAALSMFVLIGFILLPVVALATLIMTIIGAVRANNGEQYRYPLTIRFIN
ncbi:MAG TPA: DUF4870 domain-containing protein [Abditibacteriaceae bacterium]